MPTVFVTLVTYRARPDVAACLRSLAAQTSVPSRVLVIDNASGDGTAEAARAFTGFEAAAVDVVANERNVGYAAAQNGGIESARACGADYVLFLTPDVTLAPDHLEKLVAHLERDPGTACVSGKLLRPDGAIDSTGITATRSRHFLDRAQGASDVERSGDGGIDDSAPVFAPCGAVVLHRIRALEDVAIDGEYLDASFFAYKEDIDLAWRYRWRGWSIGYAPDATAVHGRAAPFSKDSGAAAAGRRRTLAETRRDRKHIPLIVRRLSARNQFLVIVKNEHWRTLFTLDGLRIAARQCALFGYALFCEPSTLPAYAGALRRLPGALRRRWRLRRTVTFARSRRWFG